MNFDFTDDQHAIKRTAREFLAARYRLEEVRRLATDEERGFTDEQWEEMSELGWPAMVVPEEHDGLGLGVVELVVVAEELGYALAPSPFFSTAAAALLLRAAGAGKELATLAGGVARGTVAVWDEGGSHRPDESTLEAVDGRLSGVKVAVADLAAADFVVVSGAEGRHWIVRTDAGGVTIAATRGLDPTRRLYRLELDGAEARELAGEWDQAYAAIVTALAAESVGVAQRAMEMAVAYANDRKQFGRPIGAYQAVSHRCAQMLLEVEGARSLAYHAAWACDHEPATAPGAAAMVKAYASDAGWRVTASALQVHGGIGFTWEHDLHFFLKRARANAHHFGDARFHRAKVLDLARL
jgi:alkylation response protein AidB-like acyl-CoA dehydrogenase